jgi:DNA-binding NtrC family response regulator
MWLELGQTRAFGTFNNVMRPNQSSAVCDNRPLAMQRAMLIVDDEAAARYALVRVFQRDYRTVESASLAQARVCMRAERFDVILLDHNMPGEDGLALLNEIGEGPESPAVIMITAHGSERLAVSAMKAGAYDYLAKPYEIDELRLVITRAMERQQLREEIRGLREYLAAEGQFGSMLGSSAAMREVFQQAERVAQSDLPVLILGESGTGKDLLAQEIHARSLRSRGRFVALNCAALPEALVESELFGYEKGSFTGANIARPGKFELAHQGTLFLDEIADMDPATQTKILRASESGTVERLGGSRAVPADVRIVSATNKDIAALVREKCFREDLYYRLAGVTLFILPLRDRAEDIPLLAGHFWAGLEHKYKRQGAELGPDALVRLANAPWPGNVRQLRSTLEKLFVLGRASVVSAQDVAVMLDTDSQRCGVQGEAAFRAADYREARRVFEQEYLSRKLREFGGNVTRTAAAIGLERQSLQEKIKKLGVLRP